MLVLSSIILGLLQGAIYVLLATTRMRVSSLSVNHVLMRPLPLPKEVKKRETAEVSFLRDELSILTLVRKSYTFTAATCAPGTASRSGVSPCKECEKGFYQSESGAQFCHKCDFRQTTRSSGSTRKKDCSKLTHTVVLSPCMWPGCKKCRRA